MFDIRQEILGLFAEGRALSQEEIFNKLGGGASREDIGLTVRDLKAEGRLMSAQKTKLIPPSGLGYETGVYWASTRGYGFISPQDGEGDLFVPPGAGGDAWHNDLVLFSKSGLLAKNGRPEAAVFKVLKRNTVELTGKLELSRKSAYVIPESARYPKIKVPAGKAGAAKDGDMVRVALSGYGGPKGVTGVIIKVFGAGGTREASVAALLHEYGVIRGFSDKAAEEARAAPQTVSVEMLAGRRDLRGELIITIDGADAKDLDDAVSLSQSDGGGWILGVHIADVSHYVKAGSPLDKAAFNRGTSVYFADQVVPMLPRELSNGICSLNPRVDRLTMSVVMTMDPVGNIVSHELFASVIRTAERMTYEDCNLLLDGKGGDLHNRYANIQPMLESMAALAEKREAIRKNRGALSLESIEGKILCDENGNAVGVEPRVRDRSERVIEEFMLAANETVAEHMSRLDKPTVYRVHEKPGAEKLENFKAVAAAFGYVVGREPDSQSLQKVLDRCAGTPEAPLLNDTLLHSMMKARYSPTNLGHYGLAADYYCHFTSPIRRYPDLAVHRLLKRLLAGGSQNEAEARIFAAEAAENSSRREIKAEQAEREIEKLYKAEYMGGFIGDEFEGKVSGVRSFGVFVMLPNTVEGLIAVEDLPGDGYEYDEKKLTLISPRTGMRFSFGMDLRVTLISASPVTGQVSFTPAD